VVAEVLGRSAGLAALSGDDWARILSDVKHAPPYRPPVGLSNWQRRREQQIIRFP
jgi:hypothetical protein